MQRNLIAELCMKDQTLRHTQPLVDDGQAHFWVYEGFMAQPRRWRENLAA
jgi:hypothetical protein